MTLTQRGEVTLPTSEFMADPGFQFRSNTDMKVYQAILHPVSWHLLLKEKEGPRHKAFLGWLFTAVGSCFTMINLQLFPNMHCSEACMFMMPRPSLGAICSFYRLPFFYLGHPLSSTGLFQSGGKWILVAEGSGVRRALGQFCVFCNFSTQAILLATICSPPVLPFLSLLVPGEWIWWHLICFCFSPCNRSYPQEILT